MIKKIFFIAISYSILSGVKDKQHFIDYYLYGPLLEQKKYSTNNTRVSSNTSLKESVTISQDKFQRESFELELKEGKAINIYDIESAFEELIQYPNTAFKLQYIARLRPELRENLLEKVIEKYFVTTNSHALKILMEEKTIITTTHWKRIRKKYKTLQNSQYVGEFQSTTSLIAAYIGFSWTKKTY